MNVDGATLGNGPDPNRLFPGPDGRLYAVGYPAPPTNESGVAPTGPWHLFAVTLPEHPVMRPTKARLSAVQDRGHVQVTIGCSGQPGRYCTGQITLTRNNHALATEPYALAPNLSATHTLSLRRRLPAGVRVAVDLSNHSVGGQKATTVRLTFLTS